MAVGRGWTAELRFRSSLKTPESSTYSVLNQENWMRGRNFFFERQNMNTNVLLVVLAAASYGLTNVLLEKDLKSFPPLLTTCLMGVTVALIGATILCFMWGSGADVRPEVTWVWLIALGAGVPFFFGDFFCVLAYGRGAKIPLVTIGLCLIPVFASLFKFIRAWIWEEGSQSPDWLQLLAWGLAIASVVANALAQKEEPSS